jgi:uncharacterized protein YecE (DUF72 family)
MLHTDIPHEQDLPASLYIGIAGWAIRREHSERFGPLGSHLQRYATLFNCVEINSCFYRPHRQATYERWADSVPEDFRFAVKLPKVITHELRLVDAVAPLDRFLTETSGLGGKLGPILVQLRPSFAYDETAAESFFASLRDRYNGPVVLEPRHETWFTSEVEQFLREKRVARVAADPLGQREGRVGLVPTCRRLRFGGREARSRRRRTLAISARSLFLQFSTQQIGGIPLY